MSGFRRSYSMNQKIDTLFLERCILALEKAVELFLKSEPDSIESDMYRSACVKEFEIILEQSGKLLKKALNAYFHSSKEVDKLTFKAIFRQAAHHSIISIEETERWLAYRDNRNSTAHDYGARFAEETIELLPQFIKDAQKLTNAIKVSNND
jgi:nucleotidyltransferase substrate binding protein (TIGR01987 family)